MTCTFSVIMKPKFCFLLLIIGPNTLCPRSCIAETKRKKSSDLSTAERIAVSEQRRFNEYKAKKGLHMLGPGSYSSGGTKKEEKFYSRKAQKRAYYEQSHFNDYQTKMEVYKQWPELDRKMLAESCRLYLSETFLKNDITTTNHEVRNIFLFYKEIAYLKIGNVFNPVEVTALECTLLHAIKGRKFIQFTRSPTSESVYLVNYNNGRRNIMEFFIAEEVGKGYGPDIATYRTRKTREEYRKTARVREYARKNDTPEEQLAHEKEHYEDYHLHKELYEKWPELENDKNKEEQCRKLLKRILPQTDLSLINPTMGTARLGYPKLQLSSTRDIGRVKVAEFCCHIPQRVFHSRLHFIRAPKFNCKYLVKQVQTLSPYLQIRKRFCEDDEEKSRIEVRQKELLNNEFGSAINSDDNALDITDFPINDVRMELI